MVLVVLRAEAVRRRVTGLIDSRMLRPWYPGGNMESDPKTIRIGELLIKAGFVTAEDLDEALEIAKQSGQLVGRVLTMSGFVTEQRLRATLRAQEHLKSGDISIDIALRALDLADKNNAHFDNALNQVKHAV